MALPPVPVAPPLPAAPVLVVADVLFVPPVPSVLPPLTADEHARSPRAAAQTTAMPRPLSKQYFIPLS